MTEIHQKNDNDHLFPTLWISRNLKIIDNRGFLVSLSPNIGQLMLARMVARQRRAGFPVRIVLVKPRQVGWSTWSEAEAFCYINHNPNRTALVVSADLDSTNLVFNMAKLYQEQMPAHLQLPTSASTRKEIVYAPPHRSRFLTQTAGKDVLGRGGTIQFFHGSEVAFWPKAKAGLAAVLQMVPNTLETTVILESTANGVGGAFYDMFMQAVDRQRVSSNSSLEGYIPVFFPWYKFPEYRCAAPKGYSFDDDDFSLKAEYGLSDDQLYWRRLKLQELGGDVALFRQEYPATYIEAFQTSGNPIFTAPMLRYQKAMLRETAGYMFNQEELEPANRSFNCWKIVSGVDFGSQYCMGIDTMEGRLSDVADPKSKLDCDAAVVLDRTKGEVVAAWHGQGNQRDFGFQCLWAARHYNDAWIAPEIPHSMTLLNIFKEAGYDNIYNRQQHDQRLVVQDSENLGWRTDLITRGWLVNDFIVALRDNAVKVQIEEIVKEMETFVRDKNGSPRHQPGFHDDLLFALMIALQVHLRCPLSELPYQPDFTGEIEERGGKSRSLLRIGAVDDCILEGDEDYYEEGE